MVLGWFVVTALLSAHAVRQATAARHTTLIIEFSADSVSTALAATINSVSAANAASKSSSAYSAAVERGAPAARAAAVAAVAQSAASLQPAVSALTSLVTSAAADKTGVKFVQQSVYTSVLQGTALSVSSRADALRLKQELETNQLIKSVYIAVSTHLL
jgi:Zn-dependent M28 family amino/carboxypeptidase